MQDNAEAVTHCQGLRTLPALALTAVLLGGCSFGQASTGGASGGSANSGVDTGASPDNQGATSAISRLPVDQDLTFSGPLGGRLVKAVTSCGGTNGQYSAALTGDAGSVKVVVYLTLVNDKGPGRYPARNDTGAVNIAIHTPDFDYEGVEGGFVTNTDRLTGTIDAQFTNGETLRGTYRCTPT